MRATTRRKIPGREKFHDKNCEVSGCRNRAKGNLNGKRACTKHLTASAAVQVNTADNRIPTEPLFLHREPFPKVFYDLQAKPAERSRVMQEWTVDIMRKWRAVMLGLQPIPTRRSLHGDKPGRPIPASQRIGAALIGYAEEACGVSPRGGGRRYAMPEVHHGFFLRAFELDPETDRYKYETSILTTGKKNMKSFSSATILRACLDLPIVENPYLTIGAPSILKGELLNVLMKLYRQWPGWTRESPGIGRDEAPFSVLSTVGTVTKNVHPAWPVEHCGKLETFACGTGQQQQIAPNGLQFIDELGRMPSLELYEDFKNAKVASVSTPLIIISVLGSEHSPLERVVRRQQKQPDPRVYLEMHQAPVDAPLDSIKAIKAANPCLKYAGGPLLDNILDAAAEAKRNPALVGKYKLEHFNLPSNVSSEAEIMTAEEWSIGKEKPEIKGPVCIGLDLAGDRDCAAVSIYDPITYGLISYAFFPGRLSELHALEAAGRHTIHGLLQRRPLHSE